MTSEPAALIAIDWGTTSLRAARLDAQGKVLEEKSLPRGILTIEPGEFATFFKANFIDWTGAKGQIVMISGMAGSKQGWQEAPYCPCPAGFGEMAAQLAWIDRTNHGLPNTRIAIVPGLSCLHSSSVSGVGTVPDVMRGEEVQILGAMQLAGSKDGVFVLPGTHNKWANVADGRVTGFRTFMTGEFYALLSRQSLLGKTIDADAEYDDAAFTAGVAQAQSAGGLLHHAFGARTLSLFSRMTAQALASYLSGLVIGEELREQAVPSGMTVHLIGSPALTQRYERALASRAIKARTFGAEATWAGLFALAQSLSK